MQERLTAAAPGETIVYAVGFLVIDIHQAFLAKGPNAAGLNKLAGLALTASNRGNMFLTQRRVGLGRFEYRSTKSYRSDVTSAHMAGDSIERG